MMQIALILFASGLMLGGVLVAGGKLVINSICSNLQKQLADYFAANGKYPESLAELPVFKRLAALNTKYTPDRDTYTFELSLSDGRKYTVTPTAITNAK